MLIQFLFQKISCSFSNFFQISYERMFCKVNAVWRSSPTSSLRFLKLNFVVKPTASFSRSSGSEIQRNPEDGGTIRPGGS